MSSATVSVVVRDQHAWTSDADLQHDVERHREQVRGARGARLLALAYGSLGVIYGDIGTSPLYAFSSIFPDGAPADDPRQTLGAFSMIFWSLTTLVLVKYVFIMLNANDHGEGGTFALYSLIRRALEEGPAKPAEGAAGAGAGDAPPARRRWRSKTAGRIRGLLRAHRWMRTGLLAFVLVAISMMLGDGVLTPAISVISAVEGLKVHTDISRGAIVGITCGIIFLLFVAQSFGTHRVSFVFSPFVLLWLTANAGIGVYNIAKYSPSAFKGLSPTYIYYFWSGNAHGAWLNLGNVMLAVTGCEALYADMGHLNKASIQLAFSLLVYPCLTLTYLGQTAMALERPEAASAIYWNSVPDSLTWPMLVLATAATIIASQALISGAFSVVQQALSFNCFPRVTVKHTSKTIRGQVYIPEVNYLLMLGTLAVVLIFKSSAKIGAAYGLAVITVMLMTTCLAALVMVLVWELPLPLVAAFWLVFSFIEAAFFSSGLAKVPNGAWFTLGLACLLWPVLYVWHWGHSLRLEYVRRHAVPLPKLLSEAAMAAAAGSDSEGERSEGAGAVATGAAALSAGKGEPEPQQLWLYGGRGPAVSRVPGLGIYYTELLEDIPPVLARFLTRMPVVHQVVVLLTVRSVPLPHVGSQEQLLVRKLPVQGFFHVVARYGYMDRTDHGQAFVDEVVHEITEYLGMGISARPSPVAPLPAEPNADAGAGAQPAGAAVLHDAAATWHSAAGRAAVAALQRELRQHLERTSAPEVSTPGTPSNKTKAAKVQQDSQGQYPWMSRPSNLRTLSKVSRSGSDAAPPEPPAPAASALASPAATGQLASSAPSAALRGEREALEAERRLVQSAYLSSGATYILGRSRLMAANRGAWLKILMLEGFYTLLANNACSSLSVYKVPTDATLHLGVTYEV